MTRFAIGLGSNLGDRRAHLTAACRDLEEQFGDLVVSALYETAPVGGPEQGPFLNAVVVVETDVSPFAVLEVCQQIEQRHKRERQMHWGPRTLDLDIIATDGPPCSEDKLTIPHPRAGQREFVLRPLVDVWPDAEVIPGATAKEALDVVDDQGVVLLTSDWL